MTPPDQADGSDPEIPKPPRILLALYYATPVILGLSFACYLSPFYVEVEPGGATGRALAFAILGFMAVAALAWMVAITQLVLGILWARKGLPSWKHHVASGVLTFITYGVITAMMMNGFVLTA